MYMYVIRVRGVFAYLCVSLIWKGNTFPECIFRNAFQCDFRITDTRITKPYSSFCSIWSLDILQCITFLMFRQQYITYHMLWGTFKWHQYTFNIARFDVKCNFRQIVTIILNFVLKWDFIQWYKHVYFNPFLSTKITYLCLKWK
jgi:hypothetical protein